MSHVVGCHGQGQTFKEAKMHNACVSAFWLTLAVSCLIEELKGSNDADV
jgi:hypothetical protein